MRIESVKSLKSLADKVRREQKKRSIEILVCAGTGCLANGALEVAESLERSIKKRKLDAKLKLGVKRTGCHGFCEKGPLVVIQPSGIFYKSVRTRDVKDIVEKTLVGGEIIKRLLYRDPLAKKKVETYQEIPFYSRQHRIALRNIGKIDPAAIEDYISRGGTGDGPRRSPRGSRTKWSTRATGRGCAAAAGEDFPGAASGAPAATRPTSRATCSATPMKAIRARSWIGASARATPTR